MKNLRVLLVDDLPSIHEDIRKILLPATSVDGELAAMEVAIFGTTVELPGPAFELDSAYQGQQALAMVEASLREARPYALAFVDMRMPPGWDGVETIERLWAADPRLQVVICTAFSDHSWDEVLRRLTATDRLLILKKPFDPIEVMQLAHALTTKWRLERQAEARIDTLEAAVRERTTEISAINQSLKHLATHDALTQLPNRVLLMDRLSQALAHARRTSRQFVVAVIDLDRFKWVNDSLGHAVGDALLRTVSLRIAEALRESDTLARIGGDEFVVVMHDLQQADDAIQVLNRIVANVAQPMLLDGSSELAISCSIGCSTFPDDGQDAEELLQCADAAMYQAKDLGRNTVQIFNAELRSRAASRARLEADLRHAIERGELVLHYQPQVDLRSGAVNSVEALLRWQHPELGSVPPGRFIPIAEASGLIIPIGEWVLQQACQQIRGWHDQGLPPVRVAVNVSAKQMARPGLIDLVSQCLKQSHIDPACLELELTETVSMDDPQTTIPMLHRLKELGVSLSIDDFGTGYSNMQYLTRLPIDTLKLDGSFVRGITTEPGHRAIAEAVISMAHRLDLRVVAEMTETEGQVVLLHSLGCDQAQGWFFARALPAAECAALLAKAPLALPPTIGRQHDCKTLLVLDDEAIITESVKDLLEGDGYQVIVANQAEEAFELLARHAVGVVLSDQCMPGMTGVDFLSAVRRLYPETTRLIFSAQCDFDAAVAAINRGAVHKFLQKPLRSRELRAVVAEAFEA